MITVDEMRVSYDWEQAFIAAGGTRFTLDDVKSILGAGMSWGDYAETTCVAVFLLNDGRYGYLSASCDTTGWDCQAGGEIGIAATHEEALTFLSDEERATMACGETERP